MIEEENLKLKIERLEKENKALKGRCSVLGRGMLCVFCPYECEHRSGEYEASNK